MKEQLNQSGKIIDIQKLKSKVVIYIDDFKMDISHLCFVEFNLYVGKELSIKDINDIKAFNDYSKHLNYALNLIKKYQYTTYKLKKKLLVKEIDKNNVNKIMDYIAKYNLIDDAAFANDYAFMMMNNHKGIYRIKNKLKDLGINEAIINGAINSLDKENMIKECEKYIKTLNNKYKGKNNIKEKIINSLLRQGYTYNEINKALSNIKIIAPNYQTSLNNDYQKFKRIYDDNNKIIKALRNKGYSYSKIKEIMKETNDDLY